MKAALGVYSLKTSQSVASGMPRPHESETALAQNGAK
jgi:hypothetical protein